MGKIEELKQQKERLVEQLRLNSLKCKKLITGTDDLHDKNCEYCLRDTELSKQLVDINKKIKGIKVDRRLKKELNLENYNFFKGLEYTDPQIMREFDVSKEDLQEWKRAMGLGKFKKKKEEAQEEEGMNKEVEVQNKKPTIEDYWALKNKGMREADIAKELGMSTSTYYEWKREVGLMGDDNRTLKQEVEFLKSELEKAKTQIEALRGYKEVAENSLKDELEVTVSDYVHGEGVTIENVADVVNKIQQLNEL